MSTLRHPRSIALVVVLALTLVGLSLVRPTSVHADTNDCPSHSFGFNAGNLPNGYGSMVVTITANYTPYNDTVDANGKHHWACAVDNIQNIGYANINHAGTVRGDLYSCYSQTGPCAWGDGYGDQNYIGDPYGLPYKPGNGASYWSGGYYGANTGYSIFTQSCWSGNEMFQPSGSNNQYFIYSNVGGGSGIWCAPYDPGQ